MSGVLRLEEQNTATYCAVITESGELSLGLGDMDVHQQITEQYVSDKATRLLARLAQDLIRYSKLHIQRCSYWVWVTSNPILLAIYSAIALKCT